MTKNVDFSEMYKDFTPSAHFGEEFRPSSILGVPFYVSNFGRIAKVVSAEKLSDGKILDNLSILTQSLTLRGYLRVSRKVVHRIVATEFNKNENAAVNLEVNHKNAIKTDNSSDNLEWCDRKHNMRHAFENGLMNVKSGSGHYRAKISESDAVAILTAMNDGANCNDLADIYGISPKTVESIFYRKIWKTIDAPIGPSRNDKIAGIFDSILTIPASEWVVEARKTKARGRGITASYLSDSLKITIESVTDSCVSVTINGVELMEVGKGIICSFLFKRLAARGVTLQGDISSAYAELQGNKSIFEK